jgi:S-adenosylmethionine decarboxylase
MFNCQKWYSLDDYPEIQHQIKHWLIVAGFTVIKEVEHHFSPMGYTGLWLLGESHLAVHTFPEENKGYLELSSCVEVPFNQFLKVASIKEIQ